MPILNIGCGNNKIKGCINSDMEVSLRPDVIFDVKPSIPFKNESIDKIYFSHAIEHIEELHHEFILKEMYRVLVPGGKLFVSYPEFTKVAKNYIENHRGMQEFWKHTVYGLQRYKSDYHVALMDSRYFVPLLKEVDFENIICKPEPDENYNTFILATKGKPMMTYEEVLKEEVFGNVS